MPENHLIHNGLVHGGPITEIGVAQSGLSRWIRQYQQFGETGLQNKVVGRRKDRLPAPIAFENFLLLIKLKQFVLNKIDSYE